jgi:hypothetical protein
MKLTLGQLKQIILETLSTLPPREKIESQLQDTKFDKEASARILSSMEKRMPPGAKLTLQGLSQALHMWQSNRASWQSVVIALDRLYSASAPVKRKTSYSGLSAARL